MASKEGGWGWVVVLASFLIHLVTCGVGYSSACLYLALREDFGESRFLTSWVGSLLLGMTVLAGLPACLLVYLFGYRVCVMLGGLLAAAGFALSTQATELYHALLSVGLLSGLGFGLSLTPSIMVLDTYFYRKRDVATSVVISGVGVGLFTLPVLLCKIEELYGWRGLAYLLTGMSGIICFCGALYRPVTSGPRSKMLLKMFEPCLFRSPTFVCLCVSNILWSFGISAIYLHLPSYAMSTGLDVQEAFILIAVTGVASFTSRTIFIIFSRSAKLDHISSFLCTVALTAILAGLFPELFKHKAGQIGYAIMLGLHTGFWTTFTSHVASELVGEQYIACAKGYVTLCIGLGLLGGAPVAGWIYDQKEKYDIIFYLAGSCLLLSGAIMFLVNLKGFHFRPNIDWASFDSEGKSGTSRNHPAENEATGRLLV